MSATKLSGVEITKERVTKNNRRAGFWVKFDCTGGCGKQQSRFIPEGSNFGDGQAITKEGALLVVVNQSRSLSCYACDWKNKSTDERALESIVGYEREMKYSREQIAKDLEYIIKNAQEELDRMNEHPTYTPYVNQMTNWTLHHAKKLDENGAKIDTEAKKIAVLREVIATPTMICEDCGKVSTKWLSVGYTSRRGNVGTKNVCVPCTEKAQAAAAQAVEVVTA